MFRKQDPKINETEPGGRMRPLSEITGVCQSCRDQIEWKRRYGKYKPLVVFSALSFYALIHGIRVLEHCEDLDTQNKVIEEILGSVSMLAHDQYGNYVIQHVLEHGKLHERSTIIKELAGKIVQMSQ